MLELTEENLQEIDDISAICAGMNEEDDNSWIEQLDLNNTRNSSINQSLDVSSSVLQELDENSKNDWLFPVKGFEKRDYQLNISKAALMHNTLIILPTGLGKTFIASVAIYNFMRWFPQSKIIFMAPTRPLVHQQMSACYDVVGIPKTETAEMTGRTSNKKNRKTEWETKRVFFATPQVIQSDIKEGIFPSKSIKLLVFDEAHKAKGDYAYCKVIEEIYKVNQKFRVIGMTATAGKTADIIQIIQNLMISKIEHRSESSIDVHKYTHKKKIDIIPIKLTSELQEIFDHFIRVIDPIIKELRKAGAIQTNQISKGYLIMQRKKLIDNYSIPNNQKSTVLGHYAASIGFYHSLEILQRHSVHLFLKSLRDDENRTSYKFFIARDFKLTQYVKELEEKYNSVSPYQININPLPNGVVPALPNKDIDFGHPKFDILKTKLKEYFDNQGTKVIIFCEYRDTTHLIYTLLLQLRPKVMPSVLIGQGGSINQKDQLNIMKNFREGSINTLICTSVAEEGLDIGDVDLVICFDISTKNAVRFVQRIGRTARKRSGHVIVLATEGKELSISRDLLYSKDTMNKSLTRNNDIFKYLYKGPRLFPKDFNPKCIEMKFLIARDEDDAIEKKPKTRARKSNKKNQDQPTTSKGAITNYLKPVATKSKESLPVIRNNDVVMDIDQDIEEPMEIIPIEPEEKLEKPKEIDENFNEILDNFKVNIEKIIEEDGLSDESYRKIYIEYCAEKEVESVLNLIEMLKQPVKEEYEKFELDIGDIELKFIEPDDSKPKQQLIDKRLNLMRKQKTNKFVPVKSLHNSILSDDEIDIITKTPISTNINSPLPLKFTNLQNSSTPIRTTTKSSQPFVGFQPNFEENSPTRVEPNSPIKNMSIPSVFSFIRPSPHMNNSAYKSFNNQSKTSQFNKSANEPVQKKLEFLGILSIEDIFEGCDSHFDLNCFSKCSENIQKSPSIQNDVIECSIAEPTDSNKILSQLNVNNFSDIFEMTGIDKSVREMEKNILQEDEDDGNLSDKTQIYDVEEEIAKIEESHKENKESFVAFDLTGQGERERKLSHTKSDDSFLKKTDLKPNLAKLMNAIRSSSSFGQTNILRETNTLKSPESPTRNDIAQEMSIICTPPNQEITIRSCDSTPDLPNKSIERSVSSPMTSRRSIFDRTHNADFKSPEIIRKIVRPRRKIHNPFLQTQAGVDDHHGSSDEDEDHDTSLNGFVCHESIHDETMMHAKYLKSIQSPSAARSGRFVLKQLQPANISEFYSQAVEEESQDSEDDLDSFIVDNIDDSTVSEMDELELAEQALKEIRKKRKLKENGNQKKKRKVFIADSDSSDEGDELRKLRDEVLANPD